MPPEICPVCGAEVPPKARACPECGSDEETGWSDKAKAQSLGLPDEDFDYDEFVKEEFGDKKDSPLRPKGLSWFWWVVALVVLIGIVVWFLRF